jgi:hypothetical protein
MASRAFGCLRSTSTFGIDMPANRDGDPLSETNLASLTLFMTSALFEKKAARDVAADRVGPHGLSGSRSLRALDDMFGAEREP